MLRVMATCPYANRFNSSAGVVQSDLKSRSHGCARGAAADGKTISINNWIGGHSCVDVLGLIKCLH
jgi:hypothetical protein